MARKVIRASGRGWMLTSTSVAMPSVPSLPTKRPRRSRPGGSSASPPRWAVSPSGRTTSRPTTWLVVTPYLRQWGPPEFSATLPPRVAAFWLAGSGGKK